MRKSYGLLQLILVSGLLVQAANASPIRRTHRPWLMVGHSRKSHVVRTSDTLEVPEHSRSIPVAEMPVVETPAKTTVVEGPVAPVNSGDRIAEQATRYEGTRYKFGGTNKKGIDCSGLVMRVFEDLKMKRLPHASSALYDAGEPVALSNLRPGDLVFFKNTYRGGISHVGVYAGHNKFVHAANHRSGVIMTALSDPYYQLHYAGARRLY